MIDPFGPSFEPRFTEFSGIKNGYWRDQVVEIDSRYIDIVDR